MNLKKVLEETTPRPWAAVCTSPESSCNCGYIFNPGGIAVCKCIYGEKRNGEPSIEEMKQNQLFIAHVVNNFEQLLEAAKIVLEQEQSDDSFDWEHIDRLREAIHQAEEIAQ